MNQTKSTLIPSLYVLKRGEESVKVALRLTRAKSPFVIRLTGGCGYMSQSDSEDLNSLFLESLHGFSGAFLFGGTRMVKKDNPAIIVPGITEIPSLVRHQCPESVLLGVVPRTGHLEISDFGLIVNREKENDYLTIVHPDQDICLVVQQSVDTEVSWETEFEECIKIISSLQEFAQWRSLLVSYNGGSITEKEIFAWAKLGWPVLLIKDSGRISEKLSLDKEFLHQYPNVHTSDKNAASIRRVLLWLGVPLGSFQQKLQLVRREGGN